MKTPIQVTQHLLGKGIQASSKEKQQQSKPEPPAGHLGPPVPPVKGPVQSHQLCTLWAQMPVTVSFERRRQKRNKNFLTGLYRAASSPTACSTVHLQATCCMHSSPTHVCTPATQGLPFQSPTPNIQERQFFWYSQVKGNNKPSLC